MTQSRVGVGMALLSGEQALKNIIPTGEKEQQQENVENAENGGMLSGISNTITAAVDKVTTAVGGSLFRVALVIVGLLILYIGLQSYLPKIK